MRGWSQLWRFFPRGKGSKPCFGCQPEGPALGEWALRTFGFKLVGLTFRRSIGLWETDSTLKGHIQNLTLWDPGNKREFERSLGQLTCWPWRAFQRDKRQVGLPLGTHALVAVYFGSSSVSRMLVLATDILESSFLSLGLGPAQYQSWETPSQAASWTGTQPHPPGDQLPQAVLSPQPPWDPPATGLTSTGTKAHPSVVRGQGYQPWDSPSLSRAHQQSDISSRIPKGPHPEILGTSSTH